MLAKPTDCLNIINITTMKFAAAFLTTLVAVSTVQGVPNFGNGALHDDLQYFLNLVPMEDATAIVLQYLAEDEEFSHAVKYLKSAEFKQMLSEVESIPELLGFLNYLENHGVYAYRIVNKLNTRLGLDQLKPPTSYDSAFITGGLGGLFNDVKELVSYDKFIHGYVYKMKTSEAFRDFIRELKSPEFQKMIDGIYANKIFQKVHASLVQKGVNLHLIEDIAFVVLGITFPGQGTKPEVSYDNNKELLKDFQDFAELALTPEVIAVFLDYFQNDKQVEKAFFYMLTKEFHEMVRAVENMKEYQELVIYLQESGLDVYAEIQKFHKVIGMEDYVPPKPSKYHSLSYAKVGGGIRAMVDDIMALLPVKELKALYKKKLETSKAFADFIARVSSPEFQKIVNAVYTHKVFLEMREKALQAGLDLGALEELLRAMLGLEFPKP